jgi:hypothetical protein
LIIVTAAARLERKFLNDPEQSRLELCGKAKLIGVGQTLAELTEHQGAVLTVMHRLPLMAGTGIFFGYILHFPLDHLTRPC